METINNQEARSKKVRKAISEILPLPIRIGIPVIALIIILLLIAAFTIPLGDTSKGTHPENRRKTFIERLSPYYKSSHVIITRYDLPNYSVISL